MGKSSYSDDFKRDAVCLTSALVGQKEAAAIMDKVL